MHDQRPRTNVPLIESQELGFIEQGDITIDDVIPRIRFLEHGFFPLIIRDERIVDGFDLGRLLFSFLCRRTRGHRQARRRYQGDRTHCRLGDSHGHDPVPSQEVTSAGLRCADYAEFSENTIPIFAWKNMLIAQFEFEPTAMYPTLFTRTRADCPVAFRRPYKT